MQSAPTPVLLLVYRMYFRTSCGVRLMPYAGAETSRKRLGESFGLHCLIDSAV